MKLFDVSNHGLATIALLVAVLWGVIFVEKSLNARTQRDYQELMRSTPSLPAGAHPALEEQHPLLPGPSEWDVS